MVLNSIVLFIFQIIREVDGEDVYEGQGLQHEVIEMVPYNIPVMDAEINPTPPSAQPLNPHPPTYWVTAEPDSLVNQHPPGNLVAVSRESRMVPYTPAHQLLVDPESLENLPASARRASARPESLDSQKAANHFQRVAGVIAIYSVLLIFIIVCKINLPYDTNFNYVSLLMWIIIPSYIIYVIFFLFTEG